METLHRQNQVRQLKDTWPMDGLCIYKYQLATQVDRRQVHPSQPDSNRRSDLRLPKHPKSLTTRSKGRGSATRAEKVRARSDSSEEEPRAMISRISKCTTGRF